MLIADTIFLTGPKNMPLVILSEFLEFVPEIKIEIDIWVVVTYILKSGCRVVVQPQPLSQPPSWEWLLGVAAADSLRSIRHFPIQVS